MRILITGASGFVGSHLLPHLAGADHQVIALRRGTPGASAEDWQGPADLRQMDKAPDWPAGVEAVVHLAAANPAKGEKDADNAALLRASNVDGTLALARRCAREGVKRFIFLSSANVHAPRSGGGMIKESDPLDPQSPYAASKAEAETALRGALAETPTDYCILRPAPVFGKRGRGTVAQLARLAGTPLPLPLKGLGGRRSLIAVEDLVDAIALALTVPGAANETLLLAGGAATPEEIVGALRKGAGRSPRLLPAPTGLVGALARMLNKGRAWDNLSGDFVLSTDRANQVLGWLAGRELESRLGNILSTAAERTR